MVLAHSLTFLPLSQYYNHHYQYYIIKNYYKGHCISEKFCRYYNLDVPAQGNRKKWKDSIIDIVIVVVVIEYQ